MSLYRKYRPQTFSHLVGQDHINQTLNNALKLERVNHAYLFTGPRGTGKTTTARLMAKAINCLDLKDSEPCNSCEICTDINDGKLIDLIEIDAASNRGIDEIRDLREKINFAPTRAKSKVYIIDEVHMLTKEAFNALLKTLEEPPEHVYFILATTEVHKIPETILSRCQRFDFRRIDEKVMIDRLKYIAAEESIETDDSALEIIVHHAEGGMRDAIGLMEQLSRDKKLNCEHVCEVLGVSGVASIEKLYGFLKNSNIKEALKEINDMHMDGFDLTFFNKRFLEFLRKEMLKSVNEDRTKDTSWILKVIEYFQDAYSQARYATIPQLPLEVAVIRSCTGTSGPSEDLKAVPSRQHKRVEQIMKEPETKQTVPEPEAAEKKSPDGNNPELSLENIKKQWDQIEKLISNPIAKRGLRQCSPLKVENNIITLGFRSSFHMDKLLETASRTEAEKAFFDVFGKSIKLVGEVRNVAEEAAVETATEVDSAEKELEEKVLDIFSV